MAERRSGARSAQVGGGGARGGTCRTCPTSAAMASRRGGSRRDSAYRDYLGRSADVRRTSGGSPDAQRHRCSADHQPGVRFDIRDLARRSVDRHRGRPRPLDAIPAGRRATAAAGNGRRLHALLVSGQQVDRLLCRSQAEASGPARRHAGHPRGCARRQGRHLEYRRHDCLRADSAWPADAHTRPRRRDRYRNGARRRTRRRRPPHAVLHRRHALHLLREKPSGAAYCHSYRLHRFGSGFRAGRCRGRIRLGRRARDRCRTPPIAPPLREEPRATCSSIRREFRHCLG